MIMFGQNRRLNQRIILSQQDFSVGLFHFGKINDAERVRIFRLIARFSKYDFWNPGEILD